MRGTRRRALWGALMLPMLSFVTGCYSLVPVANVGVPAGATIALDINDAGRLALGGTMGPEIGQVEGRLIEQTSSEYLLAVTGVRYLRDAGEQVWTGERIRIKSEHVRSVSERRFSKGRSALIAGAALGAVAFIITRSISGSGQEPPGKTPTDTAQSVRIPRF
jgi:hypothetical protein